MISLLFQFTNEFITIVIDGNQLYFRDSSGACSTIEGLKMDYAGTIREFPDLETREDWRQEGIRRFKEKIYGMQEDRKAEYLIQDLKKFGYKIIATQKKGFRRVNIKQND